MTSYVHASILLFAGMIPSILHWKGHDILLYISPSNNKTCNYQSGIGKDGSAGCKTLR